MTPRAAATAAATAATAAAAAAAATAAAAAAAALPLPPPALPLAIPLPLPLPRPLLAAALSLVSAEAFLGARAPLDSALLFTVVRERRSSSSGRGGRGRAVTFRLLLEPKQAAAGAGAAAAAAAAAAARPLALARRRGRTLYSVTPAGASSPVALLKSNVWGTAYLATSLSAAAERGGGSGGRGRGKDAPPAEQLAAVAYRASSFLGPRGPRQLAALVPAAPPPSRAPEASAPDAANAPWPTVVLGRDGENRAAAPASPPPLRRRRPLAAAAAARDGSALVLSNVAPRWSASAGAFVLDFGGRVTAPSVKNFQLVAAAGGDGGDGHGPVSAASAAAAAADAPNAAAASNGNGADDSGGPKAEGRRTVLLQFGKTAKDSFSMDVRGPLTPLQGFLICLTALDGKLACE